VGGFGGRGGGAGGGSSRLTVVWVRSSSRDESFLLGLAFVLELSQGRRERGTREERERRERSARIERNDVLSSPSSNKLYKANPVLTQI